MRLDLEFAVRDCTLEIEISELVQQAELALCEEGVFGVYVARRAVREVVCSLLVVKVLILVARNDLRVCTQKP